MELTYVLITPARNEEEHIEKTIKSVITQTVLPEKWVVVSDGSTDRTDEIVNRYTGQYPWIELVRMPEHREHNFASKAHCFNTGYQKVKDIVPDIIVNLDADISFEKDYIEFLLNKFLQIPDLGVAGTRFLEDNNRAMTYSSKDVSGQCQMFRRQCFMDIGEGYTPMRYGGIDRVAVMMAQMKGWQTITFGEKTFFHYRVMGTAKRNKFSAGIHFGREDYILGNHPLWQFFRTLFQMTRKPYLIGGMSFMLGYIWASLNHTERISKDLIDFHRKGQMQRLKSFLGGLLNFKVKIER